MTTQKDFKHLVRSRMTKTGESYTAARFQLMQARAATGERKDADFAKLAGMSDAAIKKATGCAWDKWVSALDRVEAHDWPHREIAEYIQDKYQVPDWWTQTVTVGYERIKGLRDKGQRRGGGYEATRSKTVPVPVSRLFRAWSDKRTRTRWLDAKLTIRTSQKDRSMRISWNDGTAVDLWFEAKGKARSQVAVTHRKLTGKADAEARKAFWGERLDTLAGLFVDPRRRAAV